MISLKAIKAASANISPSIHRTPIFSSRILSERIGASLHLKCECFQKTGSFKPRGALNKILSLSDAERAKGLITVSAGNHAQAVAWAAREVNAPCAVVMPTDAPGSKIDAVKEYQAEVILHPDRPTLFDKLNAEKDARGATFVHPFDDPVLLAGSGTTGLEIMQDMPTADVVVVPVGGGGLLGGVTSAVKQMNPATKVIAVELEAGPGMKPALAAGKPVPVSRPPTLADGMTPPFVGALPLQIVQEAVDDIVMVSEAEIIAAMKLLMTRCKLYVEASGAAAVAALLAGKIAIAPNANIVAIVSGGNIDLAQITQFVSPA